MAVINGDSPGFRIRRNGVTQCFSHLPKENQNNTRFLIGRAEHCGQIQKLSVGKSDRKELRQKPADLRESEYTPLPEERDERFYASSLSRRAKT